MLTKYLCINKVICKSEFQIINQISLIPRNKVSPPAVAALYGGPQQKGEVGKKPSETRAENETQVENDPEAGMGITVARVPMLLVIVFQFQERKAIQLLQIRKRHGIRM
jgi:hypothetical protein